jgi:hypothetical protein
MAIVFVAKSREQLDKGQSTGVSFEREESSHYCIRVFLCCGSLPLYQRPISPRFRATQLVLNSDLLICPWNSDGPWPRKRRIMVTMKQAATAEDAAKLNGKRPASTPPLMIPNLHMARENRARDGHSTPQNVSCRFGSRCLRSTTSKVLAAPVSQQRSAIHRFF